LSHSAVVYSDTSRTAVYTPSLLGALPISCETISLQLLTHRQRVRLHPVGASAGGRDALGYSQQRLHMMSDLVRDDVCLGEIARSAEARMQLLVETEVDVRLTVGGAIEWTDLRLRIAATRLHCAGEQHQLRLAVLTPGCGEDLTPGLLGISQHNGDELAQLRLGWRLFVGSLFDP